MDVCPLCQGKLLTYAYGRASDGSGKTLIGEHGDLIYAGCMMRPDSPFYRCRDCKADFCENGDLHSTLEDRDGSRSRSAPLSQSRDEDLS